MKEFGSITDFVAHLATVAVAVREADHAILTEGAELVEKRAKAKIGHYQEQAGPFIAWPELAEATKSDRARQGFPEDEPLLRTGETRDSIEHTVGREEAQIGSNDDKAVWQELGTEHIPPRSFLGGAMAETVPELLTLSGRMFVAALVGEDVFQGRLPITELKD